MINLEGIPPGPKPVPVQTNPVTYVRGAATWPSGQREIGEIIQPNIFNAGDAVMVHNLDSSSFIGIISQVGQQNLIFDSNLTIDVKPGAAIVKIQTIQIVTPPQQPITVTVQGGGGGMVNPMTTTGDIIYASNNLGSAARRAIGAAGQVLTVVGGVPQWAAAGGGGSTSFLAARGEVVAGGSVAVPLPWTTVQIGGNDFNQIPMDTANVDPHGMVDTVNHFFIAPVAGMYRIVAQSDYPGGIPNGNRIAFACYPDATFAPPVPSNLATLQAGADDFSPLLPTEFGGTAGTEWSQLIEFILNVRAGGAIAAFISAGNGTQIVTEYYACHRVG